MMRSAMAGVLVLWGSVTFTGCGSAPAGREEVSAAPERYGVMYSFTPTPEERRALVTSLDDFRARHGVFFVGDVFRLGSSGEYALVFTLLEGSHAREVGVQFLLDDSDAFWTGILDTAEGIFSVVEVEDVDGDSWVDIVYCREDVAPPRVEALIQTRPGWRLDTTERSYPQCGGA